MIRADTVCADTVLPALGKVSVQRKPDEQLDPTTWLSRSRFATISRLRSKELGWRDRQDPI